MLSCVFFICTLRNKNSFARNNWINIIFCCWTTYPHSISCEGPRWVPCGTHGYLMGLYFPSLSPRGYHMGKTSWVPSRTYTGTMGTCLFKSDSLGSKYIAIIMFFHCFRSTYTHFTLAFVNIIQEIS